MLGLDREEAKEAAALLEEWDEELRAEEAEAQNEAEAAAPVEYERFDASPDWAQYSVDDQAVQIDDTIYVPGW